MSKVLSKWSAAAHAHCLAGNTSITPMEALMQFGNPPSRSSAANLLDAGYRNGWFRREETREEGARGQVLRIRYFAVDKVETRGVQPCNAHSYFHNLKRCRSVFELGDTL